MISQENDPALTGHTGVGCNSKYLEKGENICLVRSAYPFGEKPWGLATACRIKDCPLLKYPDHSFPRLLDELNQKIEKELPNIQRYYLENQQFNFSPLSLDEALRCKQAAKKALIPDE